MTTKRTNGPCTCKPHSESEARDVSGVVRAHLPDCPSLYPAQQEPDALTRLSRIIRQMQEEQLQRRTDALAEQAIALVSEAREEQRSHGAAMARFDAGEDDIRNLRAEVNRLRKRLDRGKT
jgi:hypothetical protein